MRLAIALSMLVSLPALAVPKTAPAKPAVTQKAAKPTPTDRLVALSKKKLANFPGGATVGYMNGISEDEQQTMSGVGVTVKDTSAVAAAYKVLTGKTLKNDGLGAPGQITTAVRGVDLVIGTKASWAANGD